MAIKRTLQQWSVEDSTELYGIRNWGAGYFGVSPEGDVVIYPSGENKGVAVSVPEVIRGMRERGYDMPVLLRRSPCCTSRSARPSPRSATRANTAASSPLR